MALDTPGRTTTNFVLRSPATGELIKFNFRPPKIRKQYTFENTETTQDKYNHDANDVRACNDNT